MSKKTALDLGKSSANRVEGTSQAAVGWAVQGGQEVETEHRLLSRGLAVKERTDVKRYWVKGEYF